jgi:hypothetical protein
MHFWPTAAQPQLPVEPLHDPPQQFVEAPLQGEPSGMHVPHTRLVPVSRQMRPVQQSGPYRKSRPEQGPPVAEQPHALVAWLQTPSQQGVFGGELGGGLGWFS